MNLFINGSNREKNCFNIISDIKSEKDELISLAHKDMKYCLGCGACINKLENYCIQNDYMSNNIYQKLIDADKIIIASPLYMSSITGILKTMLDRLYPFYHHQYFNGKEIYLILSGHGSYIDNEEEISDIIKYFEGISEWMNFKFKFLTYFSSGDPKEVDDIKKVEENYFEKIENIKNILK